MVMDSCVFCSEYSVFDRRFDLRKRRGAVIIKPVLDAVGVMSVSSISFLSGCTVLAMSVVSVYKKYPGKIGKAQCAYRNRAGDRCGSGRCCRKEYVPDVEICRGQ